MSTPDLGESLTAWARGQPAVSGVVLIGSRTRAPDDAVWRPDAQSDWDFQIITSEPDAFSRGDWARGLGGMRLSAYGVRRARIGGVPKVSALFAGAEADFVILPAGALEELRRAAQADPRLRAPAVRGPLQDLALIIRPGWRFLLGAEKWEAFYRQVVAEIPDPRLDDAAVRELAECFWCDLVWVRRKLDRGELLAAQRQLHQALAETNFRLLHELRLRRGERTFPEARRIERIATAGELAAVTVSAAPEAASLRAAADRAAAACEKLVRELVGDSWRRPEGST